MRLREALPDEIERWLGDAGEPRYRALQIFRGLQARGLEPAGLTDVGKTLRARLAAEAGPPAGEVAEVHHSVDGTTKLVIAFADGAMVETVLMGTTIPGRMSQCISTQVGCAMGCVFCHSGIAGLKRNLTASEILAQIHLARVHVPEGEQVTNVVLMGMGEPLHNYEAVRRAIQIMTHPDGLGLSTRRVTLSTVGLVRGLEALGRDFSGQIALAVSLHAGDDAVRSRLVPVNRRHDLESVVAALRAYPLPARRRITIEYTLISGENDDLGQARKLARLLRGMAVKVNLIPMNQHGASPHEAPPPETVEAFRDVLVRAGLSVFVRHRRGADIAAACGQLALRPST
ncbi:MAG: 23S rRNA (adenine(2503)-C(2))-methyltransferase RlmN [Deltaproteobacteria bacterium]|nr:23S rRNA (adenine(2503)-C(2))-methyltransferase RlmN [Deltaproteobacteria bacterium]